MSRSAVPSASQVEMLLNNLEEKRFLATGHARTSHARDRTRAAWQEIALKLNSDGSGCIKTWQQWAKYWKDKKAAAKKKASQVRMSRLRTGGGAGEEIFLSAVDERIVAIMGGESFAVGDRDLEINPFIPSPVISSTPNPPLAVPLDYENIQEVTQEDITHESESILQDHAGNLIMSIVTDTGRLQTEQSTSSLLDVQPSVSNRDNIVGETQPNITQSVNVSPVAAPHRSPQSVIASPRRRRVLTARRRLIQRTPPSQRRSQLASLTERFIAIEEKRVENEKKMCDILMEVSRSIKILCEATKAFAEHRNNN